MIIAYAALFVLALIGAKISIKSFNTKEYLSMDSTNAVRGIFIMLVFLSHLMQYYTYTETIDVWGGKISKILGQMIVVMFMFYSGYGIGESVKRKGSAYIKSFPTNRVLKTWLHFAAGVFVFFVLNLIIGKEYPVDRILLSFIGWENIGNSNWYIFAVIALYIITWIAFTLFKNNKIAAAAVVTALTAAYVVVMYFVKDYWWYDTVLCYVAGLWYSLFKDKIESLLTKNNIIWAVIVVVLALGWWHTHRRQNLFVGLRILEALMFALAFVAASLKVSVKNKALIWMGKYTFEIYILMRVPMIVFGKLGVKSFNLYIYVIVSLVATFVISFLFSKLLTQVDKLLFKPKKIK